MASQLPERFKERDLFKLLGKHDCKVEETGNGGSHIFKVSRTAADGRVMSTRMSRTKDGEFWRSAVTAVRESLELDPEHDVSDHDFMHPKKRKKDAEAAESVQIPEPEHSPDHAQVDQDTNRSNPEG